MEKETDQLEKKVYLYAKYVCKGLEVFQLLSVGQGDGVCAKPVFFRTSYSACVFTVHLLCVPCCWRCVGALLRLVKLLIMQLIFT